MKYIKIVDFCKKTGHSREDVDRIIENWSVGKEKVGNAWAITEYIANRIDQELTVPEEMQSVLHTAKFLHNANNPRYVFAKVVGFEGKHPVLVPRKLQGRLEGKNFKVEKIEDVTGITFRHEDFMKLHPNAKA